MTMTKQEQLKAIAKWFNDGGWQWHGYRNAIWDKDRNTVALLNGTDKSPQVFTFTRPEVEAEQERLKVSENKDWNGEGFPPVGVECEYKHPDFGWTECSTVGLFQGKMVVAPNGGGFYQASKDELRPIKSDREQWICFGWDVMANLYIDSHNMPNDLMSEENAEIYLGAIYDAGLAKMPES